MFNLLLAIIYVSFISLGLPDAILGSAWPSMYPQLGVPISYAGIIAMIISGGTIFSSFMSGRMLKKFGTGKVTAISVAMTAFALLGFSLSHSYWLLCVMALPYGLGAGSVDAALNNFVALHYKAKHMSWLHSFWGVGATLGPYIMGTALTKGMGWNHGYRIIFYLQIVLTAVLIFSLPLWKEEKNNSEDNHEHKSMNIKQLMALPGAKEILTAFFCYCSLEFVTGLWGSSYMVVKKGLSPETAATLTSVFYLGITIGRFLSGFMAIKFDSKFMVRLGQTIAFIGTLTLIFSFNTVVMAIGFILIGLGCAPVYPSLLHQTPQRFGKEISQSVMGIQMASAYIGSTFSPMIAGLLFDNINISFYPFVLTFFVVFMFIMVEISDSKSGNFKKVLQ